MCATKVGEDQMGENQTLEKTEEECVEAMWEKRTMREKWLGQRFLMMGAGNQILSLLGFVLGVQWCRGMRSWGFLRGCSVRHLGVQGYGVKNTQ